jgi:hypothetical protein
VTKQLGDESWEERWTRMYYSYFGDGNGNPGLVRTVQELSKTLSEVVDFRKEYETTERVKEEIQNKRHQQNSRWLKILTFVVLVVGLILSIMEIQHKAVADLVTPRQSLPHTADEPVH